jgi:hypothetical protein
MLRIRILLCAALACLSLALGAAEAVPALGSHGEGLYFEASSDLLNPVTRAHTITQLQALGVHALRVELNWGSVAPGSTSATRPSFDATNPASYDWGEYATVLSDAQQLHWQVLLTVTSPAPRWATSNHVAPYVTRPNDQQFQEFMTAVGRQFGSEVSLYAIWNEPNHPDYLQPQFVNHVAASPRIYRGLFQAGYAGLQAAGIGRPKVLMGETAPTGTPRVVAPLAFLRGVLCLNVHYKKASSCSSLPAYGYGHHAYTTAAGPFYKPPAPQDVTIGVLSRLTHALDLAARAHAIKAKMPIYLTEFGVQSKPNKYLGVTVAQQAEFDAISEHIAYSNPRVVAFSQYLLRDDPLGGAPGTQTIGFQTGLEYVSGAPKPLYAAFPVPLVVTKQAHGYSLWGLVRPTIGVTKATVLVQRKGSKSFSTLKTVATNSLGYWSLRSTTPATRWRVRWKSPSGTVYTGPPIRAYAAP